MYKFILPPEDPCKILIWSSSKDDPEAVSIAKPATRHSGMIGKVCPSLVNHVVQR